VLFGGEELDLVYLIAEGSEASTVKHPGRSIAYFFHRQVDPTYRLISAVGAAYVGGLAGAGNWSKGTIEQADYLAQVDIRRITCEAVTPTLPFPTLQYAVVSKTKQDEFEKLWRDLLRTGQINDAHWLIAFLVGQRQKRLDSVLGFF
jgi:hypothetical protein